MCSHSHRGWGEAEQSEDATIKIEKKNTATRYQPTRFLLIDPPYPITEPFHSNNTGYTAKGYSTSGSRTVS
jgi:hypothetical protein